MQTLNLMFILNDNSIWYLKDRGYLYGITFESCYADLNCRIVDQTKTKTVAAIHNLRWKT